MMRTDGTTAIQIADLEGWVEQEKRVVLATVSSSALTRLEACFAATGLTALIRADRIFSADDSLPTRTSKPDPAIYVHACAQSDILPEAGLAVEDSLPGAQSAIAAGCPTVGNVLFVPVAERAERVAALHEAGVVAVVSSWDELADLLLPTLRGRATADGLIPAGTAQ